MQRLADDLAAARSNFPKELDIAARWERVEHRRRVLRMTERRQSVLVALERIVNLAQRAHGGGLVGLVVRLDVAPEHDEVPAVAVRNRLDLVRRRNDGTTGAGAVRRYGELTGDVVGIRALRKTE